MHFRPRKAQGLSRSHTQSRPQPPASRRSRRIRLLRWLAGLVLLGVFLLIGAGVALYFRSWSSPFLDRRIQEQWLKATGLPLTYDKVVFRPSQGVVDIRHPRLLDPQTRRPLLNADHIRLNIPLAQFLKGKPPYAIQSIDIDASLTLPIVIGEKQVSFGESGDRLIGLLTEHHRAHPRNRETSPTLALHTLRLNSAAVQLYRAGVGSPQPLLQVDHTRLVADFGGAAVPHQVTADGRMNARGDDPDTSRNLHLMLRPDPKLNYADLSLRLAGVDSLKDLPWRLPFDFNASTFEINTRLARRDAMYFTLAGTSNMHGINLVGADTLANQSLGDARAQWNAVLNRDTGRLDLFAANLASKICSFQSSGSLTLREPYPYELHLDGVQAQGPAFALVADALGRGSEIVRPADASLGMHATLRGSLRQRLPEMVLGSAQLSGLSLNSPALPPFYNLHAQAVMTSNSLVLDKGQAVVEGMPVAFAGTITGHPLRGEIRSASLNWQAKGDLVSVSTLIKSGAPGTSAAALQLAVKVDGSGRFSVSEPLAGSLVSALERAKIEGQLDLKDVSVRHPALLAPIRNLNGRIDLVENTARLTKGSAEWMGININLTGRLKGKAILWNQPHLTLTGAADFDLDETRQRLAKASPEMKTKMRAWPPLAGKADLDFTVDADTMRWAEATYNATLNLTDFATELKEVAVDGKPIIGAGPLKLREAQFALTPARFQIKRTAGRWGLLSVGLNGEFSPSGGTLKFQTDGSLAEVGRRVPILTHFFRVGGGATLDSSFQILGRQGLKAPANWQGLLADLPRPRGGQPADWRAWVARRWAFDGGGVIAARDVEWTYHAMPSRLWGINGPFHFDMNHLWTPQPVAIRGGERSIDCRGTLDLAYGTNLNEMLQGKPRHTTVLSYSITNGHLALEEWLRPWNFKHSEPPASQPQRPLPYKAGLPVVFKLRGDFNTPSASYRGVQIANSKCKLDLDVTPANYSNYFAWHDITGRIGDGDFFIEGSLVSHDLNTNVVANLVELKPLIEGITGKPNPSGLFSGKLSGRARIHQGWGWPQDPPIEGSGNFRIIESRFVSNKIFNSLGGLLKLPVFENISFSTIEGPFEFKLPRFTTTGITFENPTLVHLNVVGSYGPESKLDMNLQLQLLPKALQRIPLVGNALDIFNRIVGKVLRFRLRGTSDNPVISPL